jgi:hypothetical protein
MVSATLDILGVSTELMVNDRTITSDSEDDVVSYFFPESESAFKTMPSSVADVVASTI